MSDRTDGSRVSALVLLSILSMVYAEVYSGSSPVWFIDPFAYIITLPLYGSHAVLLLNLAVKYHRASLPHLYLFGVLFGLYESWITKVLWAGYPGSTGPMLGTVVGIAWAEFFTLAFLWHSIFSFIIPLVVYQLLCAASSTDQRLELLPGFVNLLKPRGLNRALWLLAAVMGGVFFSLSPVTDSGNSLFVSTASIVIIVVVYALTKRRVGTLKISSVLLGRRGLRLLVSYVVAQYVVLFLILLPERIPGAESIVGTLVVYGLLILLLRKTPVCQPAGPTPREGLLTFKQFLLWSGLFVLVSFIVPILADVGFVIGVLFLLATVPLGPVIFATLARRALRTHTEMDSTAERSVTAQ
ncbi:MAG: hypothetical protein HXY34_10235 [Candidatus Thorarchaeota archaeon]|nr:hypothetical protein [Candidatus Thorarchaeota archaeon]